MSKKKINIAIIGATGFTGLELTLLLSKHPNVKIKYLCATRNLGKKISFFDDRIKKALPKICSIKKIEWSSLDLVFLSLPNGQAQKLVNKVFHRYLNLRFIDLSADFRIININEYKKNYQIKHKCPKLLKNTIYSISEFVKKDISKFRIIANPGCYPTSVQLPLMPLLKKRLIKDNITIDSKSGFSGAGKNLEKKFKHKNLYTSAFAYGIKKHRHVIEIDQEIIKHAGLKTKFTFNPQLLPTFRGILTSMYVDLKKGKKINNLRKELIDFYKKDKFIKILKLNSQIGSGNVINTNNCEISLCNTRVKNRIVIFSAIDNLIKGASGQAIQNMNLIYKYPITQGLR